MESETRYDLKVPFKYALAGENVQASYLILREPSWPNLADVGKLRKWVNNALQQNREELQEAAAEALEKADAAAAAAEDDAEEDDDELVDPSAIISLLARADIPLDKLYLVTASILESKGITRIEGETQMKTEHWKRISSYDAESMVGHYISAFFLR